MSERQMTIVLLVVMGAIVLIGAGLLYWLQFQTLAALEEELGQVSKEVEIATGKKNNIPKLKAREKTLTESIERIRSQIPVFNLKEENDQFADLVDTLRKKTRVQISGSRYAAARPTPGETPLPDSIFRARYELKVTGGFYQLLNFLNHLESDGRFLVADNIRLAAGSQSDKGASPERELQLNLSTFLQRPPPAPVASAPVKPADIPVEAPPEETKRLSTPVPD